MHEAQIDQTLASIALIPELPITIRRATGSHHGSTLRTLGNAAEYLRGNSLSLTDPAAVASLQESIHLLNRLSREVFEEYALANLQKRPVVGWMMRQAVRVFGAA